MLLCCIADKFEGKLGFAYLLFGGKEVLVLSNRINYKVECILLGKLSDYFWSVMSEKFCSIK